MQIKIFEETPNFGSGFLISLFLEYLAEAEKKTSEIYNSTPRGYVTTTIKKPLILNDFIVYAFESKGINISKLFKNGAQIEPEYINAVEYIRNRIASNQIENALIGNYNAGLVQRLNAIKENIEVLQIDEVPILNLESLNLVAIKENI